MLDALESNFGNPSSIHAEGREARALVDRARDRVARAVGARPREVVFTGGGSEADNLALRGVAHRLRDRGRHLIVSAVEHEAVLETARDLVSYGYQLTVLPVDRLGRVEVDRLEAELRPDTILVSVKLANNEVGTVQPVAELASVVHARGGAVFHTDATQALGKLAVGLDELGADMLTLSAHKVYGPKGVGALVVRHGTPLDPVLTGGGQERTRRSGTENVPGIVGFGAAAMLAEQERPREAERLAALSGRLQNRIAERLPDSVTTGAPPGPDRLPNFVTVAIPKVEGELLLMRLDRVGVAASAGSACASGSLSPSHVLLAMGLDPRLAGAHLRLTLGKSSSEAELDRAAELLATEATALRQAGAAV